MSIFLDLYGAVFLWLAHQINHWIKSDSPDMDIPERKLDYLFNKNIAPDLHNTPRAAQNAQQMKRLGLWDTPEDR